jgi:hypothetical protein
MMHPDANVEDNATQTDSDHGSCTPDGHPLHDPDAGRLSAAASLDIEAAGLLEKANAWRYQGDTLLYRDVIVKREPFLHVS